MMRSFFLYLSSSAQSRRVLMAMPFATRMARRFVAGETLDDAIRTVKALNAKGLLVSLDHLGENVYTEADATNTAQTYLDLLDCIAAQGLKSNVSLKLTALGLDIRDTNTYRMLFVRSDQKRECDHISRFIPKRAVGLRRDIPNGPFFTRFSVSHPSPAIVGISAVYIHRRKPAVRPAIAPFLLPVFQ